MERMEREKKISNILKFAKGEKVKKSYLRFFDEDGNPTLCEKWKEIDGSISVSVQFKDMSKKSENIEI
jgi:hypothetical protein